MWGSGFFNISEVSGFSGQSGISLFGSKATLKYSDNKLYGGTKDENSLEEIVIPPEFEDEWRVEQEFINAIRGKEKVKLTTFKDGLKYMEITEAVYKSIQTGKHISI